MYAKKNTFGTDIFGASLKTITSVRGLQILSPSRILLYYRGASFNITLSKLVNSPFKNLNLFMRLGDMFLELHSIYMWIHCCSLIIALKSLKSLNAVIQSPFLEDTLNSVVFMIFTALIVLINCFKGWTITCFKRWIFNCSIYLF